MNLKTYITILLTAIVLLPGLRVVAQSHGFMQQDIIKTEHITTVDQVYPLSLQNKQSTRVYYDGLGRTLQTISVQASPQQNDLIQPVLYDNLGRQTSAYLPYAGATTDSASSFRANAISTAQPAFYNQTTQHLIATDTAAYTQQIFENSPLQRLLQAGMVGGGFQPGVSGSHYKTISYRFNTTGDGNIFIWVPGAGGVFTTGTWYAAGSLAVTDGIDEDGSETLSFTDIAGHAILKRQKLGATNLDTYYLYNNAGMVSYIIPPKATGLLASPYDLTASPMNTLVFHFVYDTMGKKKKKKVPAKGKMSIVYDPLNRPVLIQDANMLANNQWNYIRYDAKGRAISQGIYTDTNFLGRAAMQNHVNTLDYSTVWFETRSATAATGYYSATIFPTLVTGTTLTPLAYAYYDDYDLKQTGAANYAYVSQITGETGATTAKVKGMPTMTRRTTVGASLGGTWLLSVNFYDKRLNVIQTQTNNQLNYALDVVTDYKTSLLDFNAVPQSTRVTKATGGTGVDIKTTMTYDQINRITAISQQYGSGPVLPTAAYSYNELGQVIAKNLGQVATPPVPPTRTLNTPFSGSIVASSGVTLSSATPGASVPSGTTANVMISSATGYLQTVDYRYNIRGQLLFINNSKLSNDGGVTNNDTNDLFGMQFLYSDVDSHVGNTPYFNGKISAVKWMSRDASYGITYERSYKYSYDAVNRYTASNYAERAPASTGDFSNNVGGFDESGITYDLGGNILGLKRNSSVQGTNTHIQIDSLVYSYNNTANPNQLLKVTDGIGANYTNAGFRNLTGDTSSYRYDNNGNLLTDSYKGLSIGYNYLNRTDKITITTTTGSYINYTYDAKGSVIRKQQYISGSVTTTTDYIDGFVFVNNTLQYFPMPEGRVVNNGSVLVQEFIITDQQGNARISFQDNGHGMAVVKQENSYYAFGLVLPNSPVGPPVVPNKNLYNGGSEWQNDYANNLPDYYETFYRNYDAALARWVGVDPKAEGAESLTGYQYGNNNPIVFNDPLGDTFSSTQALVDIIDDLLNNTSYGGTSTGDSDGGTTRPYESDEEAIAENPRGENYNVDDFGRITDANTKAYGKKDQLNAIGGNKIGVDHGILENPLSKNVRGHTEDYLDVEDNSAATSLFEFLAQNTLVEWGLIRFDVSSNYITTSHTAGHEYGIEYLMSTIWDAGGYIKEVTHSHEHTVDKYDPSKRAMAYFSDIKYGPSGFRTNDNFYPDRGDRGFAQAYGFPILMFYNNFQSIIWQVYDVNSHYYFQYDGFKIFNDLSQDEYINLLQKYF